MEQATLQHFIENTWDQSIIPSLMEYIRIPNKSPAFDAQWKANGHMDKAMQLIYRWCEQHAARDMQMEIIEVEGRTPLLFIEIPGEINETVLLYGHMDKQPEMLGWEEGLGPWQPVLRSDKLYGRGGADDGYSVFAALTAINALQQQNIAHPRCIIIIEASEESGSTDLPFYIEQLKARIGEPKLVICLDSGCANYQQIWSTTSLRGIINGVLHVNILTEGVHSGYASGIVPSSFRIIRELLDRVEDVNTGKILLPELQVDIPSQRLEQVQQTAKIVGEGVKRSQPFVEGAQAMSDDIPELLLNRTWRATLSVIGADGLPACADAGNVLRPYTHVKLSFRVPPSCDVTRAAQAIKQTLERDPPYGAKVQFDLEDCGSGWDAPVLAAWLASAVEDASQRYYGKPAMYMGEGGSIPFMGMLGKMFPQAQFFITGVLGPKSNAHGPNEFLHIPMGKKLTCCVAEVLAKVTG